MVQQQQHNPGTEVESLTIRETLAMMSVMQAMIPPVQTEAHLEMMSARRIFPMPIPIIMTDGTLLHANKWFQAAPDLEEPNSNLRKVKIILSLSANFVKDLPEIPNSEKLRNRKISYVYLSMARSFLKDNSPDRKDDPSSLIEIIIAMMQNTFFGWFERDGAVVFDEAEEAGVVYCKRSLMKSVFPSAITEKIEEAMPCCTDGSSCEECWAGSVVFSKRFSSSEPDKCEAFIRKNHKRYINFLKLATRESPTPESIKQPHPVLPPTAK